MIAIVIVNVPFFARTVRGTTVGLRRADFMAAARLSGQSSARIIAFELFPNVLPVVVVTASTSIGWMILETAGLSFLGLGAQPPMADLGGMLGDGRNLLEVAPHVATIPGIAILLIAVGVNLLGDGVRDILDPRLKSGGLARIRPATEVSTPRGTPRAPRHGIGQEPGALLQLRGLDTRFRVGRSVWNAVSQRRTWSSGPGEAIGIVGESGSGKTVTALSILGLVASPPGRIDGGEVLFNGEDLLGLPAGRLRAIRGDRIAYVFQDPLTTLNPLQIGRRAGGGGDHARIKRLGRASEAWAQNGGAAGEPWASPSRRRRRAPIRTSCRAASGSASALPWRLPTSPIWWSRMSPQPHSMSPPRPVC